MKTSYKISALFSLALGLVSGIAHAEPSGVFKFADQVRLVTMDPQRHNGGGIPYLRPVYESLFDLDEEGKPRPALATGYTIDGETVTIVSMVLRLDGLTHVTIDCVSLR